MQVTEHHYKTAPNPLSCTRDTTCPGAEIPLRTVALLLLRWRTACPCRAAVRAGPLPLELSGGSRCRSRIEIHSPRRRPWSQIRMLIEATLNLVQHIRQLASFRWSTSLVSLLHHVRTSASRRGSSMGAMIARAGAGGLNGRARFRDVPYLAEREAPRPRPRLWHTPCE